MLAKKNNLTRLKCKIQLNKKYLFDPLFPAPIRLTTGLTWVSRVLGELGQKSTRIKICKKISTQPNPNPW